MKFSFSSALFDFKCELKAFNFLNDIDVNIFKNLKVSPSKLAEILPLKMNLYYTGFNDNGQNFIQAIKDVREVTGLGLKEAKDMVEAVRAGAPSVLIREDFIGEIPRTIAAKFEKKSALFEKKNKAA